MVKQRSIDTLTIDGGILCLNFVNTIYAWRGENLHEYLGDYHDLIQWSKKLEILEETDLEKLHQQMIANPLAADRVLTQIKESRLLFYQIFSAIASNTTDHLDPKLLDLFNEQISWALSCIKYVNKEGRLTKELFLNKDILHLPLLQVLLSANELLVSKWYEVIKECPSCGWLFIDTTKNKKRRWCSPASCGSIEKTRRYYLKQKNGNI